MIKVQLFVLWFGAPTIMAAISALYFFTDPRRPAYLARAISSSHGAIGAILYLSALGLAWWDSPGQYRPHLAVPCITLLVLPALSVIAAFSTYACPRVVHVTQLLNLPALVWVIFVGGMSVIGDWL